MISMVYVQPHSWGTLRIPRVMLAAMPIATREPSRVKSPRIRVTPMKVSVMSVIQPKKVQWGIITLTRKPL